MENDLSEYMATFIRKFASGETFSQSPFGRFSHSFNPPDMAADL